MYKPTDQSGQPLNVIYAEDVGQFADLLTGIRDGGALSLLAPLVAPAAPSVTLQSGAITGTGYQWAVYWITGAMDGTNGAHIVGRTPYGTLTGAQSLTAQQATISISGLTAPTGAIGWGVARNKSPGGTTSGWYTVPGSEQFLSIAGTMPASFVDNVADGSLVSLAPTTNTTGTTLKTGVPGQQLDYAQITSGVTITSSTESSPTAIITGNSITYDGSPVIIEFFSPVISCPNGVSSQYPSAVISAWVDGVNIGRLINWSTGTGEGAQSWPAYGRLPYTPTAGAHTFKIQAFYTSVSGWAVNAGTGGSGNYVPAWMKVTRA